MTRPTGEWRGNAPVPPRQPGNLGRSVTWLALGALGLVGIALAVEAWRS